MSLLSWLRAHFGRPREVSELPDPHAAHEGTERSRRERRWTVKSRREVMLQLQALEKEIELMRGRRGRQ